MRNEGESYYKVILILKVILLYQLEKRDSEIVNKSKREFYRNNMSTKYQWESWRLVRKLTDDKTGNIVKRLLDYGEGLVNGPVEVAEQLLFSWKKLMELT